MLGLSDFPFAGSFGLMLDPAPPVQQRQVGGPGFDVEGPQLVRIIRPPAAPGGLYLVSLPLRDGAGGTTAVPRESLVDGTPLSGAEGRELVDLGRELRSGAIADDDPRRTRFAELRDRAVFSVILGARLRELDDRRGRQAVAL